MSLLPIKIILSTTLLCGSLLADSKFNYDISQRVSENIAGFLRGVRQGASIASYNIQNDLVDFNSPYYAMSKSLLPTKLYYNEMTSISVLFSNGLLYGYQQNTQSTSSILSQTSVSKDHPSLLQYHSIDKYGFPKTYISNVTLEVTKLAPYLNSKKYRVPTWSPANIHLATGNTQISLALPIFNKTINGIFYPFSGCVSVVVFLSNINQYLQNMYSSSDLDVFIIEKSTGYLLGSSTGASTFTLNSFNVKAEILAINSEDKLVREVATLLTTSNWPRYLLLYNNYYVQSVLYADTTPGICWYIVVLVPAVVELDHVEPGSTIWRAAVVIITFTVAVCFTALSILLYYWKKRMMQLTSPIFSLVSLLGCILLCFACICLLGENVTGICYARAYSFCCAFTIAFTPLLIKCWCVYRRFAILLGGPYVPPPSAPNTPGRPVSKQLGKVSLIKLCGVVFLCVIVDIIIISLSVFLAGPGVTPYTSTVITSSGAYGKMTYCGFHNNTVYFYSLLAYKALQISLACYWSFVIRSVANAVGGSKILLTIVYNTAFIGTILVAMIRTSAVADIVIFVVCGVCFVVILAAVLLVGPPWYAIYFIGDDLAAAAVVDEIVHQKESSAASISKHIRPSLSATNRVNLFNTNKNNNNNNNNNNNQQALEAISAPRKSKSFIGKKLDYGLIIPPNSTDMNGDTNIQIHQIITQPQSQIPPRSPMKPIFIKRNLSPLPDIISSNLSPHGSNLSDAIEPYHYHTIGKRNRIGQDDDNDSEIKWKKEEKKQFSEEKNSLERPHQESFRTKKKISIEGPYLQQIDHNIDDLSNVKDLSHNTSMEVDGLYRYHTTGRGYDHSKDDKNNNFENQAVAVLLQPLEELQTLSISVTTSDEIDPYNYHTVGKLDHLEEDLELFHRYEDNIIRSPLHIQQSNKETALNNSTPIDSHSKEDPNKRSKFNFHDVIHDENISNPKQEIYKDSTKGDTYAWGIPIPDYIIDNNHYSIKEEVDKEEVDKEVDKEDKVVNVKESNDSKLDLVDGPYTYHPCNKGHTDSGFIYDKRREHLQKEFHDLSNKEENEERKLSFEDHYMERNRKISSSSSSANSVTKCDLSKKRGDIDGDIDDDDAFKPKKVWSVFTDNTNRILKFSDKNLVHNNGEDILEMERYDDNHTNQNSQKSQKKSALRILLPSKKSSPTLLRFPMNGGRGHVSRGQLHGGSVRSSLGSIVEEDM